MRLNVETVYLKKKNDASFGNSTAGVAAKPSDVPSPCTVIKINNTKLAASLRGAVGAAVRHLSNRNVRFSIKSIIALSRQVSADSRSIRVPPSSKGGFSFYAY